MDLTVRVGTPVPQRCDWAMEPVEQSRPVCCRLGCRQSLIINVSSPFLPFSQNSGLFYPLDFLKARNAFSWDYYPSPSVSDPETKMGGYRVYGRWHVCNQKLLLDSFILQES